MTKKKDLIKSVVDETGLTLPQARLAVEKVFNTIITGIIEQGRVELRDFGIFEIKKRNRRLARNPRTNQPIELPERLVVTFKPSRELENRIAEATKMKERWKSVLADPPEESPEP
jgi:integration host factor subunit beta